MPLEPALTTTDYIRNIEVRLRRLPSRERHEVVRETLDRAICSAAKILDAELGEATDWLGVYRRYASSRATTEELLGLPGLAERRRVRRLFFIAVSQRNNELEDPLLQAHALFVCACGGRSYEFRDHRLDSYALSCELRLIDESISKALFNAQNRRLSSALTGAPSPLSSD